MQTGSLILIKSISYIQEWEKLIVIIIIDYKCWLRISSVGHD